MDSVKESYRGCVTVALLMGYGHMNTSVNDCDCKISEDGWAMGIFCSKTLLIRVIGVLLHPNDDVG
jgi:hypothetical protein